MLDRAFSPKLIRQRCNISAQANKIKRSRNNTGGSNHRASPLFSKTLTIIFIITLILGLPLAVYTLNSPSNQNTTDIVIDNEFNDWITHQMFTDPVNDQPHNPNIDIVKYQIYKIDHGLAFYIEVHGDILHGIEKSDKQYPDSICILIDSDGDRTTGYNTLGFGAEYLLDIQGAARRVSHQGFYEFNDVLASNRNDWTGWEYITNAAIGLGICRLEGQINLPNSIISSDFNAIIITRDQNGNTDRSNEIINPIKASLTATTISAPPEVIYSNSNRIESTFMNIEFESKYADGKDIIINGFGLELLGNVAETTIEDVKIIFNDDLPKVLPAHYKIIDGILRVSLDEPLTIPPDDIVEIDIGLVIATDIGMSYRDDLCVGLKLNEVLVEHAVVTIEHEKLELAYLFEIPTEISIDGAFADWKMIPRLSDFDSARVTNPDIDINEFAMAGGNFALDFYFKIHGELMTATDIPVSLKAISNSRNSISPKTETEMFDTKEKSHPPAIPEEMIVKDTLRLFIDTDGIDVTGFNPEWLPIGAEYLIEISGRNGEIISNSLFRYQDKEGKQTTWSWKKISNILAAKDRSQLETTVPFNLLNFDNPENIEICYILSNWGNSVTDVSEDVIMNGEVAPEIEISNMMSQIGTRAIITGTDYGGTDLLLNDGDIIGGIFTNVGKFEIPAGATVLCTQDVKLEIHAREIYINGTLNADGAGSIGGFGDGGSGAGVGGGSGGGAASGGGGGGYGGIGGAGGGNSGGAGGINFGKLDTVLPPVDADISKGSGGGGGASSKSLGGSGGGSIFFEAENNMYISGSLTAKGLAGASTTGAKSGGAGGGAGGGILLYLSSTENVLTITNTATLTVDGGAGGDTTGGSAGGGGGGAGGRIKLVYYDLAMAGSHSETGGLGGNLQMASTGSGGNIGTFHTYKRIPINDKPDDNDTNGTNDTKAPIFNVTINEIMFNPFYALNEWVELYNKEDFAIDLTGWKLTDNDGNYFFLGGSGKIPGRGYLLCHIGQAGQNTTSHLYGPIYNENSHPTTMLEDFDDLALTNNDENIVDYVAWGADAGPDDDAAVTDGHWVDGLFVQTSGLSIDETLGRDAVATDTNAPSDWENNNDQADPFGVDASLPTPAGQNIDVKIPEFQILLVPVAIITIIFIFSNYRRKTIKGKLRINKKSRFN
jgi:hypothetical protein